MLEDDTLDVSLDSSLEELTLLAESEFDEALLSLEALLSDDELDEHCSTQQPFGSGTIGQRSTMLGHMGLPVQEKVGLGQSELELLEESELEDWLLLLILLLLEDSLQELELLDESEDEDELLELELLLETELDDGGGGGGGQPHTCTARARLGESHPRHLAENSSHVKHLPVSHEPGHGPLGQGGCAGHSQRLNPFEGGSGNS